MLVSAIHFLRHNWRILGRPTVTFVLHTSILGSLMIECCMFFSTLVHRLY